MFAEGHAEVAQAPCAQGGCALTRKRHLWGALCPKALPSCVHLLHLVLAARTQLWILALQPCLPIYSSQFRLTWFTHTNITSELNRVKLKPLLCKVRLWTGRLDLQRSGKFKLLLGKPLQPRLEGIKLEKNPAPGKATQISITFCGPVK